MSQLAHEFILNDFQRHMYVLSVHFHHRLTKGILRLFKTLSLNKKTQNTLSMTQNFFFVFLGHHPRVRLLSAQFFMIYDSKKLETPPPHLNSTLSSMYQSKVIEFKHGS